MISYNSIEVFDGQPIPFIGKEVEYVQAGERWAQVETLTLNGQITGCSESELKAVRDSILGTFSENFKTLSVTGIGNFERVKVSSINFQDSDYVTSIPYSISMTTYPSGGFEDFYGVVDPSDVLQYTENEDRTIQISRSISARGINTSNLSPGNALDNAKSFVLSRTGEIVAPFIIDSAASDISSYLVSSEETIDRITNTVSVSQVFRGDLDATVGAVVNRYSKEISEQLGEYPLVRIQGQVNAGRYGEIEDCYDKYDEVKNSFQYPFIMDEQVSQDLYINQLSYGFSFYQPESGVQIPLVEDIFTISVSEGSDSSLFSVSINGSISLAKGCVHTDFGLIEGQFDSSFRSALCRDIYEDFYTTARGSKQNKPTNVLFNAFPISSSLSKSEDSMNISYSAEFDDRYVPQIFGEKISFEENIEIIPPFGKKQISEHYLGGKYSCNDLDYLPRQGISAAISMNGNISDVTEESLESYADLIYNSLGTNVDKKEDSISVEISEQNKAASISKSWSDWNSQEFSI